MCGAGGGDNGVGEGGEKLGTEQVGGDRGRAGIEFDACELYFGMGLAFLRSMLPQYMALSVSSFVSFVSFRQKFYLSKRPSSYCLIHFGGSSGAARGQLGGSSGAAQGQLGGGRRPLMEDDL